MTIYTFSSLFAFVSSIVLSGFVMLWALEKKNRIPFVLIALMAGTWSFFPFVASLFDDEQKALWVARIFYTAAVFTAPAFLNFSLTIMNVADRPRERIIIRTAFLGAVAFLPLLYSDYFIIGTYRNIPYYSLKVTPLFIVFVVSFFCLCSYAWGRLLLVFFQTTGVVRNQYKYILWAYSFAFFSALTHFGAIYGIPEKIPHDLLVVVCMGILAYTVIRYRLMDIRVAVSSAGIFLGVYSLTLGIPMLMYWKGHHLAALISAIAFATPAPFIYNRLRKQAEDRILKDERQYQLVLQSTAKTFSGRKTIDEITRSIVNVIGRTIQAKSVVFYLFDGRSYFIKDSYGDAQAYQPEIPGDAPIVSYLKEFSAVTLNETRHSAIAGAVEKYPAAVAVPFRGNQRLLGILFIGDKVNDTVFSDRDLAVLDNFSFPVGLAIENAIHIAVEKKTLEEEFHDLRLRDIGLLGAKVAHQMSNRLNRILATLSTAVESFDDEALANDPREKLVIKIRKLLDRLQIVIKDAMSASEISSALKRSAKEGSDPIVVRLKALIDGGRALAETKHPGFEYVFREQYDDQLELWVNDSAIQDVFANSFDNSLDAMRIKKKSKDCPQGYVPQIQVTGKAQGDTAVIDIIDNGIGIKPEDEASLFIPLFTTKGTEKGTGLGLSAMLRLVKNQGGDIQMSSQYQAWTKVTVTLPLVTPELMGRVERTRSSPALE
jgi:signal transduction histidine kinase